MKKLMIVIQMLVLTLVLTVPAMAGKKVPRKLCMTLDQGGPALASMELAIKKGGKLRYSNLRSTFYSIQGTLTYNQPLPSVPCDGSGYVNVTSFSTPVFAATLQCVSANGPLFGGLGWTLEDGGTRLITLTPLVGTGQVYNAVVVDCKTAIQK